MNVKELIELLEKAPPDAEVYRGDSNKFGDPTETKVNNIETISLPESCNVTIW